jgi:hypothetical protein
LTFPPSGSDTFADSVGVVVVEYHVVVDPDVYAVRVAPSDVPPPG